MDRFPQTNFPYQTHSHSNSHASTLESRDWYSNVGEKNRESVAYSQTRISNDYFDNEFMELDNPNSCPTYDNDDAEIPEISLGGLAELYNDGWNDKEGENAYFRFIIGARLVAVPIDSIEPDVDWVEEDDEDNEDNFPVWKLRDQSSRNDTTMSLQNNVIQHKDAKRTRVGILGYESSGDERSANVGSFRGLRRINTKWNRAARVAYHSENNKQGMKRDYKSDKDDVGCVQKRQKILPTNWVLDGNTHEKRIHWAEDVKTFDGPAPRSVFGRMAED